MKHGIRDRFLGQHEVVEQETDCAHDKSGRENQRCPVFAVIVPEA